MNVSFMSFRYGTLRQDSTWPRLITIPESIWSGFCSWWIELANSARKEMNIEKHTTVLRSDTDALYGNLQN